MIITYTVDFPIYLHDHLTALLEYLDLESGSLWSLFIKSEGTPAPQAPTNYQLHT